jgi:hypothetical protein
MGLRRIVFLGIVSLLLVGCLFGQSPNGIVNGLVLDPDDRAIAGADIRIVNDATGVQYTGKTNGEGIYVVTNLPPGPYRLQVSKIGFKTLIKPDIILNVQDNLGINFTLSVGAASEIVTVTGGAPLMNTESAAVSTVVDRQFAENLPMNGRSFQTLIELAPGVVITTSTSADNGQFSVNGQRADSNYWMVDGVSANVGIGVIQSSTLGNGLGGALGSFSALGGTNSLVSVDAMQEFRIQTSTYAPEFGRTPGAQISIVTRSGTNQFHGTVFDYFRNDALDANNWFADSEGLAKPQERQNDFGGTFSGPILKDRTFFFFSYEGLRLTLPETSLTGVPDLAARQNAIAATQPLLNAFPLPTPGAPDNPATGVAQFNSSYSNPATLDAYSLRTDHKVNGQWTLFGRYNYSPSEFTDRGGQGGLNALSVVQSTSITVQTATVGATWTASPTVTNDLRFNYSRAVGEGEYTLDSFGGAVPLTTVPFPSPFTTDDAQFEVLITKLGIGRSIQEGPQNQVTQRQLNLVEGLSWEKGKHALKFGVDFRRLTPSNLPYLYHQEISFNSLAAEETGVSGGTVLASNPTQFAFQNLGLFAQDTWRALPQLTLTYGLRWDIDFAPSSTNGHAIPAVTGFSLTDFSQLAVAAPGTAAFKTTLGNVAPRLGLAYQISQSPKWQTVVRGGFGVFYDLVSSEAGNLIDANSPPFGNFATIATSPFPHTPAQIAPPPIPPSGILSNLAAFNPYLKQPYTLEWNVAVEQSLGGQQTLSVSYVGATGRRLLQTTLIDSPPTNPNLFANLVDNTASSNYNALQVQFQRRLSRGLQTIASYTWSHSIDDGSAGSGGDTSNINVPGSNNENRGASDFDIRNAFTMGLTYDIPSPKKNGFVRALLGGWSTDNFILARSAPPVDISDENFFEFNTGISTNIRPDVVPGQPLYLFGAQYPGGKAFNPAAFTDPPSDPTTGNPLRQGNLGRNVLRGFGATQWDFAVHRDFPIRETLKLQFRAEIFNFLNHPNFGPPNNLFGGTGFGLSTETLAQSLSSGSLGAGGFNPLYQIGGPRSIQLALKLLF